MSLSVLLVLDVSRVEKVFFSVAVDFQKDKYLHIIAQDQLGPIRGPFKSTVLSQE
jgi:uncharacterized protein YPO0396